MCLYVQGQDLVADVLRGELLARPVGVGSLNGGLDRDVRHSILDLNNNYPAHNKVGRDYALRVRGREHEREHVLLVRADALVELRLALRHDLLHELDVGLCGLWGVGVCVGRDDVSRGGGGGRAWLRRTAHNR